MKKFSMFAESLSFAASHLPHFTAKNWVVFFHTMQHSSLEIQAVELYLSSISPEEGSSNSKSGSPVNLILLKSALSLLNTTAFKIASDNDSIADLALRIFDMCLAFPEQVSLSESHATPVEGIEETEETSIVTQQSPVPVLLGMYCHLLPILGKAQKDSQVHRYFEEAMIERGYADNPLAYTMLVNAYMRASNYLSDHKGTVEIYLKYIEGRDVVATGQIMLHLLKACSRLDMMAVFGLKAFNQWAPVSETDGRVCAVVATLVDQVLFNQCVSLLGSTDADNATQFGSSSAHECSSGPFATDTPVILRNVTAEALEEANTDPASLLLQARRAEFHTLKSFLHFQRKNRESSLTDLFWAAPLLAARGQLSEQHIHRLLSTGPSGEACLLRVGARLVCEGQWHSLVSLTERMRLLSTGPASVSVATRAILSGLCLRALVECGQLHLLAPYCRHLLAGDSAYTETSTRVNSVVSGEDDTGGVEESTPLQLLFNQLTSKDVLVFPPGALSYDLSVEASASTGKQRTADDLILVFLRHALVPYLQGVERWPRGEYTALFAEVVRMAELSATDIEYLIDATIADTTLADKNALQAIFGSYVNSRLTLYSDQDLSKSERRTFSQIRDSLKVEK